MRQYIVNLTNNLISKNRYDEIFYKLGNSSDKFIAHVKCDLEIGDVRDMNPETLGKIMCSFELGDVMATKKELYDNITFSGFCEDMLRELVSVCLAYAIKERVDDRNPQANIPRWKGRIPGSGFAEALGDIKKRRK